MWKNIPSFSGYQASSSGKIRNSKTGKVLAGKVRWDGYIEYNLMKNGKGVSRKGHRLVASAFGIKGTIIDHKNNNRADNRPSNLRGTTSSVNNKKENKGTRKYQNDSKTRTFSSKKV